MNNTGAVVTALTADVAVTIGVRRINAWRFWRRPVVSLDCGQKRYVNLHEGDQVTVRVTAEGDGR